MRRGNTRTQRAICFFNSSHSWVTQGLPLPRSGLGAAGHQVLPISWGCHKAAAVNYSPTYQKYTPGASWL